MPGLDVKARWSRPRNLLVLLGLSLQSFLGVRADGELLLTEQELRAFDGTNDDKLIYVAIDGIIFDVSAAPTFYGPGGPYHHFAGRDGSRAWVSECWDAEDQLTWRMDGIDDMFMPKYLDEMVEQTSKGEKAVEDAELMGIEEMMDMAKVMLKQMGKVSKKQKAIRREADAVTSREARDAALAKWVDFFRNNDKYKNVGYVVHDKDKPEPPPLCSQALKKRPLNYGKLEGVMSLGNNPNKKKKEPKMPDYIKNVLKEKGATGGELDDTQPEAPKDEL